MHFGTSLKSLTCEFQHECIQVTVVLATVNVSLIITDIFEVKSDIHIVVSKSCLATSSTYTIVSNAHLVTPNIL